MRFWWLPVVAACSSGATAASVDGDPAEHREGLEQLCFAEVRSGGIEVFPFAAKMQTINGWLDDNLDDAYVQSLHREKLPQAPLPDQGELLRRHASEAGIETCPMAGLIDFLGRLSAVAHGVEDCQKACVERHAEASVGVEDLSGACGRGCGG